MAGRDEEAEAETLVQPSEPAPERSAREHSHAGKMIGRYELVERLGAGAMGVVWSARDPQLERHVAIKLVHPSLARSPEATQRLMREARAMAKVSDRAVVTIHDAGDVDGQLFIAMELVLGTNLGTMLRKREPADLLDWNKWLAIMLDAGRGLIAAHRAGVLHRDFKPDNVLVDREGRVCVGDFGLATLGEQRHAAMSSRWESSSDYGVELTSTGALVGTPVYMSPQQLRSEPVDARADQFSYCVAAWEALYGARPFPTPAQGLDAIPALAEAIERGVLPDPPAGSRVPDNVREALARGLAADPDHRWPDMAALVGVLERAGRRAPTVIKPRSRWPWIAGGVLAIGLAATIAIVATRDDAPPAPVAPPAATRLFPVSLRTGVSISPSGRYLALSSDRLRVRDLRSGQEWSTLTPSRELVSHLEVDDTTVRFGLSGVFAVMRWDFRGDAPPTREREVAGVWFGSMEIGELSYTSAKLTLSDHAGRERRAWTIAPKLDDIVISPSRRRFAYVQPGRFRGQLIVVDVATDKRYVSAEIDSPTAITFLTDDELLYANGVVDRPQIARASIQGDAVVTGPEVYALDTGWFGPLRAVAGRLYFVLMQPAPHASLTTRSGETSTTREIDNTAVSLGWVSADELLLWNRTSQVIERRSPTSTLELTKLRLDGEPANATNANNILIVAVRRAAGREVIALSRSDGRTLWRHQDGRTLAVRCAEDLHAPCFAVRVSSSDEAGDRNDELFTLEPETGELGAKPFYRGAIQDLAVDATGTRLLLAGADPAVIEIDAQGRETDRAPVPLSAARSVAWDPRGGFLLAGTQIRSVYQVGRYADGVYSVISESKDGLLSFVRPSPVDGTNVLIVVRSYAPELWQIPFTP